MSPELEAAVRSGSARAVLALLRSGSNVDSRDRYGQTALMLAAQGGDLALVEVLIAHRAHLDATAKYGLSALMLAILAGHERVAELLIAAGADPSIRGTGAPGFAGETAGDLAMARGMTGLASKLMEPR
ncbi:MAG: ankyrin repeat domain-containing protein [Burkholderiales bacterium]